MIALTGTISKWQDGRGYGGFCGLSMEPFLPAPMKLEHGFPDRGVVSDLFRIIRCVHTACQASGHVPASGRFQPGVGASGRMRFRSLRSVQKSDGISKLNNSRFC